MLRKVLRIENFCLAAFPLLYGILVVPSHSASGVFVPARLYLLFIFLSLILILKLARNNVYGLANLHTAFSNKGNTFYISIAFVSSIMISTFLSSQMLTSLFGTETLRNGSIFCVLCLTLIYFYKDFSLSKTGIIAAFIIINLVCILEYIGFRPLSPITERYITITSTFPAATIGLRGHLAGLLTLFSLLPLYWYRDNLNNWRFWTLFVLGCVSLGCTSNSSSYMGIAVALLFFLWLKRRQLKPIVLLIPVVALLSMSLYRPLVSVNTLLYSWGWVHTKADSKDLTSGTTFKTRLLLWEAAARMTLARPVFGWGPQTFNNHWYDYLSKAKGDELFRLELGIKPTQKMVRINDSVAFKDDQGKTQPRQLNYIAPHNALLDLAYSQGLVGVITFIAFLVSLIRYLYRKAGQAALFALLPFIGYGVYLMGWFITVPTTGLAAIVAGMLVAELRAQPKQATHVASVPSSSPSPHSAAGQELISPT